MRRRTRAARGFLLMEVMATLILFTVIVPAMLVMLYAAMRDSAGASMLRRARLLAQAKMEEVLEGIEENKSGAFVDDKKEALDGWSWEIQEEPVDYWPDPADMPLEETDRDRNKLDDATKDSLITMMQVRLLVRFPGYEEMTAHGEDAGEGLELTALRMPTDDDVTKFRLDLR